MIWVLLLLQLVAAENGRLREPDFDLYIYKGRGNPPSYRFERTPYSSRPSEWQMVTGRNADVSYLRAYETPVEGLLPFRKRMLVCSGQRNERRFQVIFEAERDGGNCPLTNTRVQYDFYAATTTGSNGIQNGADKMWYSVCEPSNGGTPYSRIMNTDARYCFGDDTRRIAGSFYAIKGTIMCDRPEAPMHGGVLGTDYSYGARVTYNCDTGFTLLGSSDIATCQSIGWDSEPPRCEAITCDRPEAPTHGRVLGTDYRYGASVTYSCDTGFTLLGSSDIATCQSTGWDWEPPRCEAKNCEYPGTIRNGDVFGRNFTYGNEVTFRCDDGYAIVGARLARCASDGRWNASLPICNKIRCPLLLQLENGVLHVTDRSVGRKAIFRCYSGYKLEGQKTMMCVRNGDVGRWNGSAPICRAIICNHPEAPTNGGVLGTDYSYGASVTYNCDTGFTLLGSDIATCQSTGWDSEPPRCEVKNCGDLEAPAHGFRVGNSSNYGGHLRFGCDRGYILRGPRTILCEEEGRWTGRAPTCEAVACTSLGVPDLGSRTGEDFTFGSNVSFSCFPGYEMVGTETTTCQANRQWTNPPPTCRACEEGSYKVGAGSGSCVQCPEFSSTTSIASFSPLHCICEEGTQRTEDGSCNVISCEDLTAPQNGSIVDCPEGHQTKCTFSCDPGFILAGSRDRRCTARGWTGTPPFCTACSENTYKREEGSLACTSCPSNTLTNGQLGTSIEACQCRPGFQQKEDRSCEDINECAVDNGGCIDGECENTEGSFRCYCTRPGWELLTDERRCVQVRSCPRPSGQPAHGQLECHYVEEANGNTCFIKCESSYFFVSGINNYITCGATSNYTWSHQRINTTARLPSCMEEYFSDVQLPMSVNFTRGESSDSLDEEVLRSHLQEKFQHLSEECPTCEVSDITVTDSSSDVKVDFNLVVGNPHPDPILENCDIMCKSDNMRQMIRKVFLVSEAFERKVNQNPDTLALQDGDVSLDVQSNSVSKGRPQILCEEGKVSTRLRVCVPCEPGYYLASRTNTTCDQCPEGTYQDESGQTSCKPCPEPMTTVGLGAEHSDQCSIRVVETHIPSAAVDNGERATDVPDDNRRR